MIYQQIVGALVETAPAIAGGIFGLGVITGFGVAFLVTKLRRKKQVQDARVGRLRAKRAWDA